RVVGGTRYDDPAGAIDSHTTDVRTRAAACVSRYNSTVAKGGINGAVGIISGQRHGRGTGGHNASVGARDDDTCGARHHDPPKAVNGDGLGVNIAVDAAEIIDYYADIAKGGVE